MSEQERDLMIEDGRKLYAEFQKWRETGHDISYRDWLEIVLTVERKNHDWMIEQYKQLVHSLQVQVQLLSLDEADLQS